MDIKNIKGNTFYIETNLSTIPFYKINEKEIIMLDTGWAEGQRDIIDKVISENSFNVSGIICTHAHIDHVGNNQYLKDKFGSIIAMPRFEAALCSSPINLRTYYSNVTLEMVKEHFDTLICKTDIIIMPDETNVKLCKVDFKIIHTPGHSPEHISIVTPDDVCYLGDSLISYDVMSGAKMPYANALKRDLQSKESLKKISHEKYILAHKGVFDDISILIQDNIDFYTARAEGIFELIDKRLTMEEIIKRAMVKYKINPRNIYSYFVIERIIESYVQYLHEVGKIVIEIEDGFVKYHRP